MNYETNESISRKVSMGEHDGTLDIHQRIHGNRIVPILLTCHVDKLHDCH